MKIDKKSKLLVISPHPDDEALGCGGLIGKVLKEKGSVVIVYVCVGESRQLVTKKTHQNIRLKEIDDVRNLIKSKIEIYYVGQEFTRLDIVPQKDIVEKIEDTIETFKPTIVTIPSSTSYNQDHRAVYTACITALRPTPQKVRHYTPFVLEYFEPYFWGVAAPKQPNFFLDLSPKFKNGNLFDFKTVLYKCHKTQVRSHPFPRSIENLEAQAMGWGKEIGVDKAEAYCLLRGQLW